MKCINLKALSILTATFCTTSCTTTGDPTQGGLLGWSESKAIRRSDDLAQQKQQLELMLYQNESTLASSQQRLKRLNQQIAARKAQAGTSDAEYQKLVRQRDQLAAEIRSYEQDMQGSSAGYPH